MKKILVAALLSSFAAVPSYAATTSGLPLVQVAPFTDANTTTFTFETGMPAEFSGGGVFNDSIGNTRVAPVGSVFYYAVGPGNNSTTGMADLTGFGDITNVGFYLGSADSFNSVTLVFTGGPANITYTGPDFTAAFGGPSNRDGYFSIALAGIEQSTLTSVMFSSTQNALELDNFAVRSVPGIPEPASWAMLLSGLGLIGVSLRRRSRRSVAVA